MSYEGGIDRDDEWGGIDGESDIYKDEQKGCPAMDIRMVVEPLSFAQNSIKCTDEEL